LFASGTNADEQSARIKLAERTKSGSGLLLAEVFLVSLTDRYRLLYRIDEALAPHLAEPLV
jgi:hypothetical protein